MPKRVLLATCPLLVLIVGCRAWHHAYYREAEEIRRLAAEIADLQVLEIDGNHDLTLESIWLDCVYQGVPVYFTNVTPDSFGNVGHLQVAQVGEWMFAVDEYDVGEALSLENAPSGRQGLTGQMKRFAFGGSLDFGPQGDIGSEFEPPIRSIPEFLQRLPEVLACVERLPGRHPGVRVATGTRLVRKPGTEGIKEVPTQTWAYRERVGE